MDVNEIARVSEPKKCNIEKVNLTYINCDQSRWEFENCELLSAKSGDVEIISAKGERLLFTGGTAKIKYLEEVKPKNKPKNRIDNDCGAHI